MGKGDRKSWVETPSLRDGGDDGLVDLPTEAVERPDGQFAVKSVPRCVRQPQVQRFEEEDPQDKGTDCEVRLKHGCQRD